MPRAVGIRFQPVGKIYYFDPGGLELKAGDKVVVEGERGLELGTVVLGPQELPEDKLPSPFKPVIRLAQPEDEKRARDLAVRAGKCLKEAKEAVRRHELPMKLLQAAFTLDGHKITIYFTAPGRVDFRSLVRELSGKWKVRVELHQIGPRDETKILGGLGPCGQPLCCARWLYDFTSVSLKMAKEQELPLNPEKISGLCGRLLCCLAYELEQYHELKEKLPQIGARVSTPLGPGHVISRHPIKETVTVELDENQTVASFPLNQITPLNSGEET